MHKAVVQIKSDKIFSNNKMASAELVKKKYLEPYNSVCNIYIACVYKYIFKISRMYILKLQVN